MAVVVLGLHAVGFFLLFALVALHFGARESLLPYTAAALGILFVGGGGYWEKLRRKLVAGIGSGGVQ